MKTYNCDNLLKEQLKNPKFRKEWNALKGEFELSKKAIRLRIKALGAKPQGAAAARPENLAHATRRSRGIRGRPRAPTAAACRAACGATRNAAPAYARDKSGSTGRP